MDVVFIERMREFVQDTELQKQYSQMMDINMSFGFVVRRTSVTSDTEECRLYRVSLILQDGALGCIVTYFANDDRDHTIAEKDSRDLAGVKTNETPTSHQARAYDRVWDSGTLVEQLVDEDKWTRRKVEELYEEIVAKLKELRPVDTEVSHNWTRTLSTMDKYRIALHVSIFAKYLHLCDRNVLHQVSGILRRVNHELEKATKPGTEFSSCRYELEPLRARVLMNYAEILYRLDWLCEGDDAFHEATEIFVRYNQPETLADWNNQLGCLLAKQTQTVTRPTMMLRECLSLERARFEPEQQCRQGSNPSFQQRSNVPYPWKPTDRSVFRHLACLNNLGVYHLVALDDFDSAYIYMTRFADVVKTMLFVAPNEWAPWRLASTAPELATMLWHVAEHMQMLMDIVVQSSSSPEQTCILLAEQYVNCVSESKIGNLRRDFLELFVKHNVQEQFETRYKTLPRTQTDSCLMFILQKRLLCMSHSMQTYEGSLAHEMGVHDIQGALMTILSFNRLLSAALGLTAEVRGAIRSDDRRIVSCGRLRQDDAGTLITPSTHIQVGREAFDSMSASPETMTPQSRKKPIQCLLMTAKHALFALCDARANEQTRVDALSLGIRVVFRLCQIAELFESPITQSRRTARSRTFRQAMLVAYDLLFAAFHIEIPRGNLVRADLYFLVLDVRRRWGARSFIETVRCAEAAMTLYQSQDMQDQMQMMLVWLAKMYLSVGNLPAADPWLQSLAEASQKSCTTPLVEAWACFYLAFIKEETGQTTVAEMTGFFRNATLAFKSIPASTYVGPDARACRDLLFLYFPPE